MIYRVGDRVVLQSDLKGFNEVITAGTVCTVVKVMDDTDAVIVRRYRDRSPIVVGVPNRLLRPATHTDLLDVKDPFGLVAQAFHPNHEFVVGRGVSFEGVGEGDVGTIKGVRLALNENDDILEVYFATNKRVVGLKRDFIETYLERHDPEFERSLGDEVDMIDAPRNYYLPGARMLTVDDRYGLVILIGRQDDGRYLVEDRDGNERVYREEDLIPIRDRSLLYERFGPEEMVQRAYLPGNRFVATEGVRNHVVLKGRIQPNDEVTVKRLVSVYHTNAFEDLFQVVKGEDGVDCSLTYFDLRRFFRPVLPKETTVEGMVGTGGTVAGTVGLQPNDVKEGVGIRVRIVELDVNGFVFTLDDDRVTINRNLTLSKGDVDRLMTALGVVRRLTEDDRVLTSIVNHDLKK